MDSQELTTLVGREVYTNNGIYVGEVEDVRLDLDGERVTGLALNRVSGDLFGDAVAGARGVMIPYRWVMAVADVIIVNDAVERLPSAEEEEELVA